MPYCYGPEFVLGGRESVPILEDGLQIAAQTELYGEFYTGNLSSGRDGGVRLTDRVQPFRRFKPVSEKDSFDGAICTRSKMWFPARRLVWVAGVPYGDIYAPIEPDQRL